MQAKYNILYSAICLSVLLTSLPESTQSSVVKCETATFGEQTKAARKQGFRRSGKFEKILENCLTRAEEGHPSAEANLGYMYRHGYGTPRDLEKARHWYEIAAAKGSELASSGLLSLSIQKPAENSGDPEGPLLIEHSHTTRHSVEDSLENHFSNNALATRSEVICDLKTPCLISATSLELRVLPRVATNLMSTPDGERVDLEVEPFKPWYVFGIQGNNETSEASWYAVGRSKDKFEGWFPVENIIEWKHALVAGYTIPTNRSKIVMFDTSAQLLNMVDQSLNKRGEQLNHIFDQVKAGTAPTGVVSMEPDGFIDIDDQFYLLPIVDFKPLKQLNQHALALKLIAAVPDHVEKDNTRALRRRPSYAAHPLCTGDDTIANDTTTQTNSVMKSSSEPIKVDTVFVVDMTGSMGPYLDAVRLGVADAITAVSENNIDAEFKYGLIGYRDNHDILKDVKFTTKIFKGPVKDSLLVNTLAKQVRRIKRTNDDWAEEMYAGMKVALEEYKWRDGAWRFIILIGDASSHEPGHPQATVRISSPELRSLADEMNVTIIPVYLKSLAAGADPIIARQQFQTLGRNKQSNDSTFKEIDADSDDVAKELKRYVYQYWEALLLQTQDEKFETLYSDSIDPTICSAMQTASLINYVANNDVDDVTFWAADYDLINSGTRALQTRVLVNRKQLDNLITRLEAVLSFMQKRAQSNSMSAEQLQQILYSATSGVDEIIQDEDSDLLLPKWLRGLPYQSQLQKISIPEFIRKPAVFHREQREIIARKVSYYSEKMTADNWFNLDNTSNDHYTNQVIALPLDQLP